MEFSIKNVIFRRFVELLFTEVILSLIVTTLNVAKLLTTQIELFIALFLGVCTFVLINIFQMRHCYFDLKNKTQYYSSNFTAYTIFIILQIIVYICSDVYMFTWLFAITKCAKYLFWGLPVIVAVMIFHLIGISTILVSPIGMDWVFFLEDEDPEDAYYVYDEEF